MKTRTIKTKPREVRGRKMRILQEGSAGTAYLTAEQLRAFRREAQARKDTTPEGDAVANVEDQAKDTARDLSWAAYRLTKAGVRMGKRNSEGQPETGLREIQDKQISPADPEVQAEPPTTEFVQELPLPDDPGKRPLSADEIEKGRNHQHKKRCMEMEKLRPDAASIHAVPSAPSNKQASAAPSGKTEAVQIQAPVQSPRTRQKSTGVIHGRPPYPLPRIRGSPGEAEKLPSKVQESKPRLLIKTANAEIRTEAKRSAAMAAKANAKASELAAEYTARSAQKAAKHMAEVTRRAAQRTARQLKRSSQAAIRAAIAAGKALARFFMAGGWIIVLIILVMLMCVSILSSPFGIFVHSSETEFPDSMTLNRAISTINQEYVAEIQRLAAGRDDAFIIIEGNLEGDMEPANWVDVLAIYAVHLTMREENAMDVVQLDARKMDELRRVFWDMNELMTTSEEGEDGTTTYYIEGRGLSCLDMVEQYNFSEQQKQLLKEMMSDEYYGFWSNFVNSSLGYAPNDWSGITSIDGNYTPVMSGNVMKVPKIYQFDYRTTVCIINGQRKSVSTSGCGATSMSMVIRYLTGNAQQTPYTLFKWAYENGHYSGSGLDHEAISALGRLYGVTGSWIGKNSQRILEALKSGHPVIAHMGPGIFTTRGHYIVLVGVTDDGKILVNDPNSKSRSGKAYPLSTILNQSKSSSPFMICSARDAN